MSNYISLTTSSNKFNLDQYECLKEYYRYLVGMSANQLPTHPSVSKTLLNNIQLVNTILNNQRQQQQQQQQQPQRQRQQQDQQNTLNTTSTTCNLNNVINPLFNDCNQYQKIYVDTLIDITSLTIRTSWPLELTAASTKDGQLVVNTNTFVRHLLKRSRATRSTLQLAIFYLFRIRPRIAQQSQFDSIVKCGRRMFLAALICAHKYLYDNTFTNASWAKISKLSAQEITHAERALLQMLDYKLFVPLEVYQKFENQLKEAMPKQPLFTQNHPTTSPTTFSHKRPYTSVEQHITRSIMYNKKQKQSHTSKYHIHHGIPTPEDDKVDFD